jgi:hypothetical protein
MVVSARDPSALPSVAILRRRCEALARLDRALDPDADVPTHDFDRRAGIFWVRDNGGDHLQIAFMRAGVVILGFDHESRMSPAYNDERIWPSVVDALPSSLRRALADYLLGDDITFCIWRRTNERRWRSGVVHRPRGRDVDGSTRLLAILDGDPRRYRRFAHTAFERDVPLAVIERAYAGRPVVLAPVEESPRRAPKQPTARAVKAKTKAKPKFAVGDRVLDPRGHPGKVSGIVFGLAAAEASGAISDADLWLRGLRIKPKTPRRGIWYSVRPRGGGEILVGELDLRRAPK